MLLGKVIGTLTPGIIYPGLEGVPMLLVQPLD
jgi:microcompartment protein CcmK/EutM